LNTVSENKRKPFKQHWTTILMIYNNKSASAKLQTGGQTPKEFQTEYIQSSKYAARQE
jgi:hypothetical protein